jgi:transcriptional regulator with XRE-family HTH domain
MLSLDQIIIILEDKNLSEIAKRTGLSYMTVWRVSTGDHKNVEYETVRKLSEYLERSTTAKE